MTKTQTPTLLPVAPGWDRSDELPDWEPVAIPGVEWVDLELVAH